MFQKEENRRDMECCGKVGISVSGSERKSAGRKFPRENRVLFLQASVGRDKDAQLASIYPSTKRIICIIINKSERAISERVFVSQQGHVFLTAANPVPEEPANAVAS